MRLEIPVSASGYDIEHPSRFVVELDAQEAARLLGLMRLVRLAKRREPGVVQMEALASMGQWYQGEIGEPLPAQPEHVAFEAVVVGDKWVRWTALLGETDVEVKTWEIGLPLVQAIAEGDQVRAGRLYQRMVPQAERAGFGG